MHPAHRDPAQRAQFYTRCSKHNTDGDCPNYTIKWNFRWRQWLGLYPTVYR